MTRTIITTCGTSLLQSSCWTYRGLCKEPLSEMSAIEKKQHELHCMDVHEDAIVNRPNLNDDFVRLFWEEVKYLRYLPAELASLRAIQIYFQNKEGTEPLGQGDKIKLLHSTNDSGTYCANLLDKVVNQWELLPGVDVKPLPAIGLDPNKPKEFRGALSNIWTKCVERIGRDNKDYIFNLTGGYKSVATFFGSVAYFIGDVQIFSVHEETNFENICMMKFTKAGTAPRDRFFAGTFDVSDPHMKKLSKSPGATSPV